MKILVLGAGGFVGRNFLEAPGLDRHIVLTPDRGELNLFDYNALEEYLRDKKPDIILNLAGRVGGIQANFDHPVQFFLENLDIGRNVLCAAREAKIFRLINLGSSCIYPCDADNPLREEMILTGALEPTNEGYALAKIAAARLSRYINLEDRRFTFKTLLPCNLYGRWDNYNPNSSHLLASVIRKIEHARFSGSSEVTIWGDGTPRREFMYAGDLAAILLKAIEQFDSIPEMMNVGVGADYTVREYYEIAAEVIGYSGRFLYDIGKPGGMRRKLVDISRLNDLGWKAETSLYEGIKLAYEHYLERKELLQDEISTCC